MAIPKHVFPEDFDESRCVLLPIPIQLIPIVLGAWEPLEWRQSWRTEEDFTAGSQAIIKLEECAMTADCTSGIIQAIQQAGASADMCCLVASGQPLRDSPPEDITVGVGEPPTNEFGVDDWDAFDAYLCRTAQFWVDEMIASWTQLSSYSDITGAVTVAIISGLASIVFTPIVGALVLGLTSILETITTGEISDIPTWLSNHKHDLVCAAVGASTPETAYNAVTAVIESSSLSAAQVAAVESLLSQEQFNTIFDITVDVPDTYSSIYCEDCSGCQEVFTKFGERDSQNTWTADLNGSDYIVEVIWNSPDDNVAHYCGEAVSITDFTLLTGALSGEAGDTFRIWGHTGSLVVNGEAEPTWPITGQDFAITSKQPFSCQIDWE